MLKNVSMLGTAEAIAKDATQVGTWFNRVDEELGAAESSLDRLIGACQPILRDEPANPAKDGGQIEAAIVPLAGRLRMIAQRCHQLRARADDAYGRIEL